MRKPKSTSVFVGIAITIIVIGSICVGAGLAQGGSFHYLSINKSTASWWPFNGSIGISTGDYDLLDEWDDSEYGDTSSDKESWDESIAFPNDLEIDADSGTITIQKGNENTIAFRNYRKSEISIKNGSDKTSVKTKRKLDVFNRREIIVTLKNTDVNGKIEVKNDAGTLHVNDVTLAVLQVEADAGNIKLTNVEVTKKTSIKADAGNIEGKDTMLTNANIDTNAGNISIEGDFSGKSEVDCDAGNIDLLLKAPKKEYGYTVKYDLGKVNIDGDSSIGSNKFTERADAPRFINVSCDLGNIKLAFERS